ncbi:MAG: DUF116 domain-containing protein [Candidatus Krumholzibacteriota bacterium]|nr:DUF116 domain-containing protein [Candidatus Krumholzibacteriota bacterium]
MDRKETDSGDRIKDKRILGDEWTGWEKDTDTGKISEGKSTFLYLSMIVLAAMILFAALFWYLILPRFESFGRIWAVLISSVFILVSLFLLSWYLILIISVLTRKSYFNLCLTKGGSLLFFILPIVTKFALSIGISQDRLSHSFIRVTNTLARPGPEDAGPILALFPRCLRKDIRKEAIGICGEFPEVIVNTAPGGTVARKIIRETAPRAIIAIACERDLISGLRDVAPKIPVIGIPNSRPTGPCKDTVIDTDELRSALESFTVKP